MGLRLGGVRIDAWESPHVSYCTVLRNLAANTHGGGIYCGLESQARISACTIISNSAIAGGGVFCSSYASPLIEECRIVANNGLSHGAAISLDTNATAVFSNCLIAGNYTVENSTVEGTSIHCIPHTRLTLTNCTIAENSSAGQSSAVISYGPPCELHRLE